MRGENDVVEHGESAEYKTQSLRDFYIPLLLKWFLMTGAFSTGVKQSHKNNKISKTTKLRQCSKFVTLGNNKVLTCGCFKPSTTIPIYSWFSFSHWHNKHKLLLSCIVSWLWCTDKFPWQKLNNLFFFSPTALLISTAAPNRSLLFIRLIAL